MFAPARRLWPPPHVWACAAALGVAQMIGALTTLEHGAGLPMLYALRGPETPPDRALVVSVDHDAVQRLNFDAGRLEAELPRLARCLPPGAREALDRARNVEDLPRGLYACAIEELTRRGAASVTLDVHFHEARDPAQDAALAAALAAAPRAVILEDMTPAPGMPELTLRARPAPIFAAAADAVGFFVVETTGADVMRHVSRFRAYPDARPLSELALPLDLPPGDIEGARAFRNLRYYGPPGTAPTIGMLALFEDGAIPDIAGRAAFIGSSDPGGAKVRDSFETPFSGPALGHTGGVEIVATAFLNGIEGGGLRRWPPWAEGLALAAAAFLALWAGHAAGGLAGAAAALGVVGAAAGMWLAAFETAHLHLPLAPLVLIAAPAAVLLTIAESYADARALVRRILPRQIARLRLRGRGAARDAGHVERATVMACDLRGSSALAERLSPQDFQALLSRYYDIVENAVAAEGGYVVKFIGDGVLAVFPRSVAGPDHPARACRAAAAVVAALGAPPPEGDPDPTRRLAARIGVNTGEVMIGDIGAERHYMTDALGDAVNLADRLQKLGKTLFPKDYQIVMIGEETRDHPSMTALACEPCGAHEISGRNAPIRVSRLLL